MTKTLKSVTESKKSKNSSIFIGVAVSFLLFLAIPLTQIFNNYDKPPESIDSFEISPPPPPPPPEDPPPPPEPEDEEPPPELDLPTPPLTLEQLDMVLEPGTGGALSGDVNLPSIDARKMDIGMDLLDVSQLDNFPGFRSPPYLRYPEQAKKKQIEGFVKVLFLVDENGNVIKVDILECSDPIFKPYVIDAYTNAKLYQGTKNGKPVKFKMAQKIPFKLNKH